MVQRRILLAACTSLLICLATTLSGRADLGDCSQPFSGGEVPVVGDCLIILRAGIGLNPCDPECICDPSGDGSISALDALLCLRHVVGLSAQLRCPCGTSTSTTSSTFPQGTTTTSSSTVSLPPTTTTTSVPAAACPVAMELEYLAAVRQPCSTDDECAVGSCDEQIGRCVSATDFDLGWTGRAHDQDIGDGTRIAAALECPGPAGACGACNVDGLRIADTHACRCANDNRRPCDEPFDADADDCGGSLCQCFFGPPLPMSPGGTPLCLVQRIAGDVLGTLDPDAGAMSLNVPLRTLVYLGDDALAPCPACGGRCTAPPESTNRTCLRNADCGPAGAGVCGGYDPVTGDGVRGGLCVGGPDNGFACDVHATHQTFPAPGGGGHSFDCFPESGRNIAGEGLRVRLQKTTFPQSLAAGVACGFPPAVPLSCACGVCGTDPTRPCASNADCDVGEPCGLPSGAAQPNACSDGACAAPADGSKEGLCENGPVDRFCDGVLEGDGDGLLVCDDNADCVSISNDAGACTLTQTRECFADPIEVSPGPDPQHPVVGTVACAPGTTSNALNGTLGIPGPFRLTSHTALTTYCDEAQQTVYVPGAGCP